MIHKNGKLITTHNLLTKSLLALTAAVILIAKIMFRQVNILTTSLTD
jgi:hypothetical protein